MMSYRFSRRMAFLVLIALSSPQVMGQSQPPISEEVFWDDVPMVVSATRISQALMDAPLAVTIIDRRMIEASGAREIPELFRLVPGMVVGYHDGHTPSAIYQMTSDRYARQMQVLVNGRSIYTTAIGAIPWATLHVTLDDIERIEVVRGPNSASYGANSFFGVINIITREAVLDQGTSVKANLGDQGVREVFLRHGGGAGKLDYRVSLGFVEDDGFINRVDYKRTQTASIRADYQLNRSDVLSFEGGLGTGPRGVENRTASALSPEREKTVLNHHQHIKWERRLGLGESISLQFYHIFQRNFETFSTATIPIGSAGGIDWVVEPMFVDFSRRTDRYDLELQHNVNLDETLRMAWGGGMRDDQVWGGQNLMANEEIHNHLKYGFMNLEWSPLESWLVNAGAMVEDYSTIGTEISPRLGVNYRFTPTQSMRVTASRAIRAPAMFEYAANYAFSGNTNYYSGTTLIGAGPDVVDQYWLGTRETSVETINAYEIGYHVVPKQGNAEIDIKLFRNVVKDLIGLVSHTGAGDLDDKNWFFENRSSMFVMKGFEIEGKFTFIDSSSLHLGYSYTDIIEVITGATWVENDSYRAPQNGFSLLYMMDFDQGYSAGVGYYFTDRVQGWDSASNDQVRDPVRRLDLKVARALSLFGLQTELALSARNVLGRYEEMEVLRPKASFPELNETDSSAYLTVKINM